MCGLAGILFGHGERGDADYREIAEIFTANLIANEERGREAAGIALIRDDGEMLLYKAPGPASDLVRTGEYHRILSALDSHTTCLLGHTRKPTKGDPQNNDNNHPILIGNVVGVHNGSIRNDEELFERFGFERKAEVDSEIIYHMLDRLEPEQEPWEYLTQVARAIEMMEGKKAIMAVDLRRPDRMLVVKDGSPLCVHYERRWDALFFSSRYVFLRKAFGRQVITEALPTPGIMLFEADRIPEGCRYRDRAVVPFGIGME